MSIRSAISWSVLSLFAAASTGCGIISKDLEGDARFSFEINSADDENSYDKVNTFDPASNQDVRDNRDKLESGQVKSISLQLTEVGATNRARIVAGQIDVKRTGADDNQYIHAVGEWAGIPLYSCTAVGDDPCGQRDPAIGEIIKLDMPIATQEQISHLVFDSLGSLDFRIIGQAYDDYLQPMGPVRLKGDVIVKLDFTVSVP